jgi:hypothetical protein
VQSFKKSNQLTDIESEAKLLYKVQMNTIKGRDGDQLNMVNSMLSFLKKSTRFVAHKYNFRDVSAGMINSYNQLVLDRNRILKSATEVNPVVKWIRNYILEK